MQTFNSKSKLIFSHYALTNLAPACKHEKSNKGLCKKIPTHLVEEVLNLPLTDVPREVAYIDGAAVAPAHCFLQSTTKVRTKLLATRCRRVG